MASLPAPTDTSLTRPAHGASASAAHPAFLQLDGISKSFGSNQVLNEVSLSVEQGEFFALLGPSGGGKTTLLMMIAGFVDPNAGSMTLDGEDLRRKAIQDRGTGIVFQSYALFPHMTVQKNVAFGLRRRKLPKAEVRRRVNEALALVDLVGMNDRHPAELSGGQQQRVALARALVVEPRVLLLDEPLSNLDARLRQQLGREIKSLQRRTGVTAIFVTHDLREAFSLADSVAIVADGAVRQVGTPQELYSRPNSRFVADFVGHQNIFDTRIVAVDGARRIVSLAGTEFPVGIAAGEVGDQLCLTVPAHMISVGPRRQPGDASVRAVAREAVLVAGRTHLLAALSGEDGEVLIGAESYLEPGHNLSDIAVGDEVTLSWNPDSAIAIGSDGAPA